MFKHYTTLDPLPPETSCVLLTDGMWSWGSSCDCTTSLQARNRCRHISALDPFNVFSRKRCCFRIQKWVPAPHGLGTVECTRMTIRSENLKHTVSLVRSSFKEPIPSMSSRNNRPMHFCSSREHIAAAMSAVANYVLANTTIFQTLKKRSTATTSGRCNNKEIHNTNV